MEDFTGDYWLGEQPELYKHIWVLRQPDGGYTIVWIDPNDRKQDSRMYGPNRYDHAKVAAFVAMGIWVRKFPDCLRVPTGI